MLGIDLTQGRGKVEGASGRVGNGYSVRNAFVKTQGGQRVWECVRCELAQNGARGFGFGKGCSGVALTTQDGRRQVGIGRIRVGMVTVVTLVSIKLPSVRKHVVLLFVDIPSVGQMSAQVWLSSFPYTSAKPGGAGQSWPVLDSVIVFIARVHLWSTFIVLSQYS